jgi:type III secretory pathway component EscR
MHPKAPREGSGKVEALKSFWQTYEVPITLVATAISVIVFIYTTFPTGSHVNQRFESLETSQDKLKSYVDQQDMQLRTEISSGFAETKSSIEKVRDLQTQILFELRKK